MARSMSVVGTRVRAAALIMLVQAWVVGWNGVAVARNDGSLRHRLGGAQAAGSSIGRGLIQVTFAVLLCVVVAGVLREFAGRTALCWPSKRCSS